jgi:hypothetical protein
MEMFYEPCERSLHDKKGLKTLSKYINSSGFNCRSLLKPLLHTVGILFMTCKARSEQLPAAAIQKSNAPAKTLRPDGQCTSAFP